MKRSLLAVFATLALVLGLSGPASAASPDPHAACPGKLGADNAGQPGLRAEIIRAAIAEANSLGLVLGDFQREVAASHTPLEQC